MPDHYAFLKGRRIQQDGSSDRDKKGEADMILLMSVSPFLPYIFAKNL